MRCALAVVTLVWLFFAYFWMPIWGLWVAHFIALEISVGAALLGLVVVLLLWPWRWRWLPRWDRVAVIMAMAGIIGGALPLLLAWPNLPAFSLKEHALGAPTFEVKSERNVKLEPSRPDSTTNVDHASGPGSHP